MKFSYLLVILFGFFVSVFATAIPHSPENADNVSINDTDISLFNGTDEASIAGGHCPDVNRCNALYDSCKTWCQFDCWRTCCVYSWSQTHNMCKKNACPVDARIKCKGADKPKSKPPKCTPFRGCP